MGKPANRDTFKLTNAMHQFLSPPGTVVPDARHYVGVRMQEGVPLLAADWNELEDIRRAEIELVMRDLIGEGVPYKGTGFEVSESADANDFVIGSGIMMVGGSLVVNLEPLKFSAQPSSEQILQAPAVDTTYLVYVEVWEDEIASSGLNGDDRLIDPAVGLETASRLARSWRVVVTEEAEMPTEGEMPTEAEMPTTPVKKRAKLAQLRRTTNDHITAGMIVDRRPKGTAPVFVRRNAEMVDSDIIRDVLRLFRTALSTLVTKHMPTAATPNLALHRYMSATQSLLHFAQTGEVQARALAMSEEGVLRYLHGLAEEQASWLTVFDDASMSAWLVLPVSSTLLADYTHRLAELNSALDDDDIIAAVQAQRAINQVIGAIDDTLPEGAVSISYESQISATPPPPNITANVEFTLAFEALWVWGVTPAPEPEVFEVQVQLPEDFALAQQVIYEPEVTLTSGVPRTILIAITPKTTAVSPAKLAVTVVAKNNGAVVSPEAAVNLTIGQPAPNPVFFYHIGPTVGGAVQVGAALVNAAVGKKFQFTLDNSGSALPRTFDVVFHVAIDLPDTNTGWTPIVDGAPSPVALAAGQKMNVDLYVHHTGPLVAGVKGAVHATATLNPPTADIVALAVPFVVI